VVSLLQQNTAGTISIGSLADGIMTNIDRSILRVDVSYSMDMATELSFDVLESVNTNYASFSSSENQFYSELQFAKNNYFMIGRDVEYETNTLGSIDFGQTDFIPTKQRQLFEIVNATISQGPGGSPQWQIKCYTKAVMQMKRDRKPGAIKGTGTEFVKRAAEKYGLKFWGEETKKDKKITTAGGGKQAESLWDVIKRLADDSKFVCYEVDGYLIFASEKYIMYKWGVDSSTVTRINQKTKQPKTVQTKFIPLQFPAVFKGTPGYFFANQYPTVTISDADPWEGDGSIIVDRTNGTQIRPGMTAFIGDVANFNGYYLIDSVSFSDRVPDPVSVTFRRPVKTEAEQKNPPQLAIGTAFPATSTGVVPPPQIKSAKKGVLPVPAQFDARILPLPTSADEYKYPRMISGIVSTGNIPLYSRPILTVNGETKTTYSITIYQKADLSINYNNWQSGNTAVLITPIWTVGGIPVELTADEAIAKYLSDGLYLAKFNNKKDVETYAELIHQQQAQILLVRFPNIDPTSGDTYPNTAGIT
jgi:hypothetical protein